eukprot:3939083-Rhodomonas_salina.6
MDHAPGTGTKPGAFEDEQQLHCIAGCGGDRECSLDKQVSERIGYVRPLLQTSRRRSCFSLLTHRWLVFYMDAPAGRGMPYEERELRALESPCNSTRRCRRSTWLGMELEAASPSTSGLGCWNSTARTPSFSLPVSFESGCNGARN